MYSYIWDSLYTMLFSRMYNIGETYVVTIQGTTILYDGNFVEVRK